MRSRAVVLAVLSVLLCWLAVAGSSWALTVLALGWLAVAGLSLHGLADAIEDLADAIKERVDAIEKRAQNYYNQREDKTMRDGNDDGGAAQ